MNFHDLYRHYIFIVYVTLFSYSIPNPTLSRYDISKGVDIMAEEIKIKRKNAKRGDDGYKIVSVRMKDELIERLDKLSADTNRSRNELINMLLNAAMEIVKIEE